MSVNEVSASLSNTFTGSDQNNQPAVMMETDKTVEPDRGVDPPSNKRKALNSPETDRQVERSINNHVECPRGATRHIDTGSVVNGTPTSHTSVVTPIPESRGADEDVHRRLDDMLGMMRQLMGMKENVNTLMSFKADLKGEIREMRAEMGCFLTEMREEMKADVREVENKVETVVRRLDYYEERFEGLEADFNSHTIAVNDCNARLENHESEITCQKDELDATRRGISHLTRRTEHLETKAIDQDSKSRKNNLMFYGVPENRSEDCLDVVRSLVKNCGVREAVVSACRVGRQSGDRKPRAIVATFQSFDQRQVFKKSSRRLPRTIAVSDDYPEIIREARKKLLDDLKRHKEARREAWLAYPAKLIVDSVLVKSVDLITGNVIMHNQDQRDIESSRRVNAQENVDSGSNAWQDGDRRRRGNDRARESRQESGLNRLSGTGREHVAGGVNRVGDGNSTPRGRGRGILRGIGRGSQSS